MARRGLNRAAPGRAHLFSLANGTGGNRHQDPNQLARMPRDRPIHDSRASPGWKQGVIVASPSDEEYPFPNRYTESDAAMSAVLTSADLIKAAGFDKEAVLNNFDFFCGANVGPRGGIRAWSPLDGCPTVR